MSRGGQQSDRSKVRARLRVREALLTLLLALGIVVMLYPIAVRLYNQYRFVRQAEGYAETIQEQPDEALESLWDEAVLYNREHRVNNIVDPFGSSDSAEKSDRYDALIDPLGNGQMGYLEIPRIDQQLNIYHGSGEDALLEGVGHLEGTSLPVGGASSHCVLSGHRGLPAAKLFTDLDQMEPGDLIILHILNRTLAYEVDGTEVVEPSEVDSLAIVSGEDLLTLVTCTPYAVNTHRLLIHAHAVEFVPEEAPAEDFGARTRMRFIILGAAAALFTIVVVAVLVRILRAGRKAAARDDEVQLMGKHFKR